MLQLFYRLVEKILSNNEPLIPRLKLLRNLLNHSLLLDDFRLACVDQTLQSMENWTNPNMAWNAPPLFYHPQLKISIRIIFWPAFYEVNPHQHKTWSVTGILHNALNIHTYELIEKPTSLKKERSMTAMFSETGFLTPGCIHSISNPTSLLAASIHIFNNIDINKPEENAIWYPQPRKFNLSNGLAERALLVCLKIVSEIPGNKSLLMINRIYELLPLECKLIAIQAMYSLDRTHARRCFDLLENSLR